MTSPPLLELLSSHGSRTPLTFNGNTRCLPSAFPTSIFKGFLFHIFMVSLSSQHLQKGGS
uniref:ASY1 n=1 Tax=Arundo donax TaxID=35708 RepID=A0A0A9HN15_ARUDO